MTNLIHKTWVCLLLLTVLVPAFAEKALRDPTQPYGVETKQVVRRSDIKLQAIFYSASNPTVLVGGRYYYQGDNLSGMIITKITADTVYLQGMSGEVEVSMYPTIRHEVEYKKKANTAAQKNGNGVIKANGS